MRKGVSPQSIAPPEYATRDQRRQAANVLIEKTKSLPIRQIAAILDTHQSYIYRALSYPHGAEPLCPGWVIIKILEWAAQ